MWTAYQKHGDLKHQRLKSLDNSEYSYFCIVWDTVWSGCMQWPWVCASLRYCHIFTQPQCQCLLMFYCSVLLYSEFLMPGLVDTHIHASQYSYTGTALDLPLLDWLNTYTFPVEAQYKDLDFANNVYTKVVVSLILRWPKRSSNSFDLMWKTRVLFLGLWKHELKYKLICIIKSFNQENVGVYLLCFVWHYRKER